MLLLRVTMHWDFQQNMLLPIVNRPVKRRSSSFHWGRFLVGVSIVCWLNYQQVSAHLTNPQAVLVLGGATEREFFAAKFAREHPELEIWVSSGSNPEYAQWVFLQSGIDPDKLHLDYDAVDTVTNFTTVVDKLKRSGINNIYLVTSDDHMRRAQVIGNIVLGSRGIAFQTLPVPSGREPEPVEKVIRDGLRSVLWLTTGFTGAKF